MQECCIIKLAVELAVFMLEDALSVWTNLGKHLLLDALCVSSIKTGTRRIIRLDELSSVVRLSRRTTNDSSSRRIMRLVPVFTLETHNASNNKCLPKFVQTDNASSSIKTAILKAAIEQTSINIDRNFDTFYRSEFKIPLVIEIYILLAFKSLI